MDGILPAAGSATRMRGIPKFLLPCNNSYETLLERHLTQMLEVCDTIWIPTQPQYVMLLDSMGFAQDRVVILPVSTSTMTETILRVTTISSAEFFELIMPDTYFLGEQPYALLNREPAISDLACWRIRVEQRGKLGQVNMEKDGSINKIIDKDIKCELTHAWGALTFSRKLMEFADLSQPHIGYSVAKAIGRTQAKISSKTIEGEYFDCGTPNEYLSLLRKIL